MAASTSATKNYFVGPQDGWVEIVTGAVTPIQFLRISANPHTQPFRVYVGASAPASTVPGILVCHHPFKIANYFNGTSSIVWVKVTNPCPNSIQMDGRLRLDVYADGGVLQ